ncbi:DUF885 domain-containing protein [Actinobacteria bacterium YIM 96077]|uniref:DUF885 domain-containing protein n=1 Tax=Phytoactinopolyspora halophila TaxID=1981511 RepID=A0A329R274_9ACTN|nr:DUF885 domain-containing protein [Phytoactinopolyspora halophila]AYY12124.1 DUF885 domain-containing protein [Actinobacteria bacterium YIM 96077]RAW18641.1 DUF885 domain-containing protein [Phytoactinopolyspora halophila]
MTVENSADAAAELGAIAHEYWEATLDAHPIYASFLGYHDYDDRADDLSAEHEHEKRRLWSQLRGRVQAVPEGQLGETDQITRDLLIGELDDAIRSVDMRLTEIASDQMQGAHAGLLMLGGQLQAPEPEHARMAVSRIGELARMLDQAAQRYRDGAAAGRTPARINVSRSRRQVESYLASPLESDPFVNLNGPSDWDGEEQWRADMTDAVRDILRPAFSRYRDVFANDLEPIARSDDRPGLVHLPDGEELYQTLIQQHTGLALEADDLHQIGLEEATKTIRAEFAEVGERVFGTSNVREIFDRLLTDTSLRYGSSDEILAHAKTCLDKATTAMDSWFGIRPQAPCELTPVPDYLAADVPPAYYTPPSADGNRPGEYHVNLHEPTERGRFQTASIAYHEAIPGHHLQLAISTERTDLPSFRRLSLGHNAFIEGWGLYSERLAEEMGLYEDDLDRLGMLASDAWRACRLVVDTGLHARGWTRQQAIDFMAENAPMDTDTISVEVDRYIGMPGQALSYKVGQREILEQRARAKATLGSRFDIKGFHDAVLGAATISLPVLRRRVAAWMAR